MTFERLGTVPPTELTDARLQLHWALQVVASVGYVFGAPQSDWSHTSVHWNASDRMLSGGSVHGDRLLTAGLRLHDATLATSRGDTASFFPLLGATLDKSLQWLRGEAAAVGLSSPETLTLPEHELPVHPVGAGRAFDPDVDSCRELGAWFANASRILTELASTTAGASPVRCWPHHFDMATLISLDPGKHSEEARSIGVGLSPGDAGHDQPYIYVTPWPYPSADALPQLLNGHWNTTHWVGAVLPGNEIVGAGPAGRQRELTISFIHDALRAARKVLK